MVREVYIDEWLVGSIISWVMNSLLLWATGRIFLKKEAKRCRKNWRLILAGFLGAIYFFYFCYRLEVGWVSQRELLLFIGIGLLMNVVAFVPTGGDHWVIELVKMTGLFFLLAIMTVGITSLVYYLYQFYFHRVLEGWEIITVNVFALLIITELGWGLVHRLIWEKSCIIQMRISLAGATKEIPALLDTGNMLVDPITKNPVVMVEVEAIRELLPAKVRALSEIILKGDLPGEHELDLPPEWLVRVRLLSFTSVGRDKGFLLGIRPDEIIILQKKARRLTRVIIGIYHLQAEKKEYLALLPGSLLTTE